MAAPSRYREMYLTAKEKLSELWLVIRHNRAAQVGLVLLIVILGIAVFAPWIAPYDPKEKVGGPMEPPSSKFRLGTDDVGHDILSQLIYGTRISLAIGFLAAVTGVVIGTAIGVTAGYVGGIVDEVLMRLTDVWLSIPTLLFTIFMVAVFIRLSTFPMIYAVVMAIALTSWPGLSRLLRSAVLSIKEYLYIESAKALGAGPGRIMFKHILPNVTPIILIEVITRTALAMLTEASLSFLGLGDPTAISWGMMIHYAMIRSAIVLGMWWWFLPPGLMISITVLAVMLLGLGLEEYFNPRLRTG